MDKRLDQEVRSRARHCCEYCLVPQASSKLTFPIDHIVARQHSGRTVSSNLALCCGRCNQHKGPNLAGIDPQSEKLVRLFNPRLDNWAEHFRYQGPFLAGMTDVGRTTVAVLDINHPYSVATRRALINEGSFPFPKSV